MTTNDTQLRGSPPLPEFRLLTPFHDDLLAFRSTPAYPLLLFSSFPLTLTPELVHLIRINLVRECSWDTEADVLLAPFVERIGDNYYRIHDAPRRVLQTWLRDERGEEAEIAVAELLVSFVSHHSSGTRIGSIRWRNFLQAQLWSGLALLAPPELARQLASTLENQGDDTRLEYIGYLASALKDSLPSGIPEYVEGRLAIAEGRNPETEFPDGLVYGTIRLPELKGISNGVELPQEQVQVSLFPDVSAINVEKESVEKAFLPDISGQLINFIMPFMIDQDEREAWLTQAFYLREPRIFNGIDRSGPPMLFITRCFKFLLDFGCISGPQSEHALSVLLNTLRPNTGADQQRQIDAFVKILNDTCLETQARNAKAEPIREQLQNIQNIDTPLNKRTPTVFVSYFRTDADFALNVIADLQKAGHAVWVDFSSVKGGDQWLRAITEGVLNSYAFVVVATKQALKSQWVQDEMLWAKQRNKLILTVLLEDIQNEVEFFPLVNYQGVKFFDTEYDIAISHLLDIIPPPPERDEAPAPDDTRQISQRALELQYLERLSLEDWLFISNRVGQYTPLSGTARTTVRNASAPMAQKFRHLRNLFGEEERTNASDESREYTDIIQAIHEIKRAVLLGEPGSGKTTTLWRLAKDFFDTAIVDSNAPIPVLVRLGKWTRADETIAEFIRHELGELGIYLDKLIAEKRVVLLLDGLNEIPLAQGRTGKDEQVKRFIDMALKANPDLISVISCRERDYTLDLGFDRIEILPLNPQSASEFATRYLGDSDSFDRLLSDAPDLAGLAQNPYILTMMIDIYRNRGKLPDNRGELFTQFVTELIQRESRTNERMSAREKEVTAGLAKLAYAMQIHHGVDSGIASTAMHLANVVPTLLDEELLYLASSASLINVSDTVRFSHQLLQEYFAALYMMMETRAGRLNASDLWKPANWWEPNGWEEATILLVGMFPDQIDWIADANPELTAQCVVRSGVTISQAKLERYRTIWISRLSDANPLARVAIGRALGNVGLDNRPGVGIGKDSLPDIVWCEVPAGEFVMGGQEYDDEKSIRNVNLPSYHISKYSITFSQFQTYLDSPDGYANSQWWQGLHSESLSQRRSGPNEQYFRFWNHPRDNVSWFEAVGFCRWLGSKLGLEITLPTEQQYEKAASGIVVSISKDESIAYSRWLSSKLGVEITLPTEQQWEKAARGTDGREYSYGNAFDPTKANTSETGIGQTYAVGIFPSGASLYGVMDMGGNVCEWTLSEFDSQSNIDLSSNSRRVIRGASWNDSGVHAKASYRRGLDPATRNSEIGFRVVTNNPPAPRR